MRDLAGIVVFALAVVATAAWTDSGVTRNFLMMALYATLLAQAWNVLGGYGGQISFGHSAFFGTGAYTTALLQVHAGVNAWAAFVAGVVLAALVGPYIVPHDPLASNTSAALKGPSAVHWFGTDQLGRDVFSRVIAATRLDFVIAVTSVALVFLMGGLAGVAAGFFGGWTDRIVSRIADGTVCLCQ